MCTRKWEGKPVEFGTTGYTKDHVFILYDRATDSVWYPASDAAFEAVSGHRRGDSIPILDEPEPVLLGAWLDDYLDSVIMVPAVAENS